MTEKLNANAQAILEVVSATDAHPTATEIYDAVRKIRPQIGLASIYRGLHSLVERGFIREIKGSEESCRYDAHTERHDHAICTECGVLLDIPVDVALTYEALEVAARSAGIYLQSHEVRLYGLCPDCQSKVAV